MLKNLLLGLAVVIVGLLGYVSTRPGHFRYERSGVINAPPDKVFALISDFKKGQLWNPYAQKDPNMQTRFIGTDGTVGSVMEFNGNSEVGAGKLAIERIVPNQEVAIRLSMTSPMVADNRVLYRVAPEGAGTRFTWAMEGDGGFLGKLVSVFINCEKMVAGDFEKGISNLKKIVEKENAS